MRGSDTQDETHAGQRPEERLPNTCRKTSAHTFIDETDTGASKPASPSITKAFLEGHLTPVFFGSALRNFGVRDLINALGDFAPPPRDQVADTRTVHATDDKMTAFVFKIQANMDPNHRDRIAFARVCSGKLERGMKARLSRTGKQMGLTAPQFFFASQRQLADTAYAGDVVGIPNHGTLRIGDTLTEGEQLVFQGVPNFAPEILRRVRLEDAMKAKKLKEALQQMAEEGVVQLFSPEDGSPAIVGVVGALQLDVLKERLQAEYGLPVVLRNGALLGLPLDFVRPAGRARPVRHRTARRYRPRSRRRSGVPGAGRLFAALRVRTLARHQDGRHQGISRRQGGVIFRK